MSDIEHYNHNGIPYACVLKIRGTYRSLKSADRRAVDDILKKPSEIMDLTIIGFADRAGCIIRTYEQI